MNLSKAQKSVVIMIIGSLALIVLNQEELGAIGIVTAGVILFFDALS